MSSRDYQDPAWAIKRSNEQYYRFADTAGTLTTIAAGANGSGYLESDLVIEPGDFETHFPLGAYIEWLQPGELHIESDRIDPSRSWFALGEVQVLVDQGCGQQQSCGSGLGIDRMVVQLQDEELRFTSAGGLHGVGTFRMFDGSSELQWGAIPNSDLFAHSVGPMAAAGFFMPGHLIGPDTLPWTIPSAPAVLLLSRCATNDLAALELPGARPTPTGWRTMRASTCGSPTIHPPRPPATLVECRWGRTC